MTPLYNRMTRIASTLKRAYKQVIEMALRVQGVDPVSAGVKVQWGSSFSFESFANAIEEFTALRASMLDVSPTAVAEVARKTIQPQLYNSEKGQIIDGEIEKWVKRALAGEVGLNNSGLTPKSAGALDQSTD